MLETAFNYLDIDGDGELDYYELLGTMANDDESPEKAGSGNDFSEQLLQFL